MAAPRRRRRGPRSRSSASTPPTQLIEDVPPPRDRFELQRFATQRLGKDVIDVEDVDLVRGERGLLLARHLAARPGRPGRASSASTAPARPRCSGWWTARSRPRRGAYARAARSRCSTSPRPSTTWTPKDACCRPWRSIRRVTRTVDGEVTATSMLERFGFTGDRLTARIGDLSGGERRRFQLLRLLLTEPNVLLLDEPTNDLDIETLNVAGGLPRRLARHARRRLPRPLLPRAGHRLGVGAARRRPDLDAARRRRRVPRAPRRVTRPPTYPPSGCQAEIRRVAPAVREGAGRQRRGAGGPQDTGPYGQAARAARRAGGRPERRHPRGTPRTTSGSPTWLPSSTRSPPSATRSSPSGWRPPRCWSETSGERAAVRPVGNGGEHRCPRLTVESASRPRPGRSAGWRSAPRVARGRRAVDERSTSSRGRDCVPDGHRLDVLEVRAGRSLTSPSRPDRAARRGCTRSKPASTSSTGSRAPMWGSPPLRWARQRVDLLVASRTASSPAGRTTRGSRCPRRSAARPAAGACVIWATPAAGSRRWVSTKRA